MCRQQPQTQNINEMLQNGNTDSQISQGEAQSSFCMNMQTDCQGRSSDVKPRPLIRLTLGKSWEKLPYIKRSMESTRMVNTLK